MSVNRTPFSDRCKAAYETIEPPAELAGVVRTALAARRPRPVLRIVRSVALAAAALALTFTTLLNVSPTFAEAAWQVPGLSGLCRVLTLRQYDFADEVKTVEVTVPEIELGDSELEARINLEIARVIDEEMAEATERAQAYYDAYIATGGDPASFHPLEVDIGYEVYCAGGGFLSFCVTHSETQAQAYQVTHYYNLDLETGQTLTLRDLFGPDYGNIVTAQVERQLDALDAETAAYLFDFIDLSALITETRPFYIAENGDVVIVFEKYEIAAGAAGQLEFAIQR